MIRRERMIQKEQNVSIGSFIQFSVWGMTLLKHVEGIWDQDQVTNTLLSFYSPSSLFLEQRGKEGKYLFHVLSLKFRVLLPFRPISLLFLLKHTLFTHLHLNPLINHVLRFCVEEFIVSIQAYFPSRWIFLPFHLLYHLFLLIHFLYLSLSKSMHRPTSVYIFTLSF